MKLIPLTHGKFAKVSDQDFARLSRFKWILSKTSKHGPGYAIRCTFGRGGKKIFMHRQVMMEPVGKQVDHKNGDRLDNRRSNLRVCTQAQNACNQLIRKNNVSGAKGVHFDKRRGKWVATIHPKGRAIYLGSFSSRKRAARAYNQAAVKHFGNFARVNPV